MVNNKSTKRALLTSALAILACVAMLIGTTFAWFTDTASTSVNRIQAGSLKVELWQADNDSKLGNEPLKWVAADNRAQDAILWEPGCSYNLESFRIKNNGNLALKYKVIINGLVGNAKLLEAIDFTVSVDGTPLVAKDGTSTVATVADLNNFEGKLGAQEVTGKITITGKMKTTAGNEYQEETIGGVNITVVATQDTVENDSYGNDYDDNAVYPVVATASVDVGSDNKTAVPSTAVSDKKVEGTDTPVAKVEVPAGAKLESGKKILTLTIDEIATPSDFAVGDDEDARTFEIKMLGLDKNNTEKISIDLYVGKGLMNPKMYHKGVEMAAEDYGYNAETGIMTIRTATFSPFMIKSERPAATVNGKPYKTVAEAISAADNTTVVLANNYDGNIEINGKTLTLDFNGNTVNGILYIGCTNDGFTSAKAPSTVTLRDSKGNGGVTSTASSVIYAKNGSKLTIDSGNYVCEYAKKDSSGYSNVIKMTNCELTVNGGYLHNNAQVGNYNRVINVDNGKKDAKVTVNGGKLEGTKENHAAQWPAGDYSYIIASDGYSDDKFPVEINGGEFISHTGYSYMTQCSGDVVVNNCVFTDHGVGSAFNIKKDATVTVKGGTFTLSELLNSYGKVVSGLANYVDGTLTVDPVTSVKVNYKTNDKYLAEGATQSEKGADGFYTISK
mgnify:CR=1 FL=1